MLQFIIYWQKSNTDTAKSKRKESIVKASLTGQYTKLRDK